MAFSLLLADYARWHYMVAPAALFHIWFNLVIYIEQLFSLRLHAQTLFAPWHRVTEKSRKRFDFEAIATALVVNIMSRLIGFILRSFILLIGFFILIVFCLSLIPLYLFWYTAPVIVTSCILSGIALIIIFYGNTW